MATRGYWALCEGIISDRPAQGRRAQTSIPSPDICFVCIPGFFYADAMAPSRFEAVLRATQNLKNNIRFLMDFYQDVPTPSYSDTPPSRASKEGMIWLFIPLTEIGFSGEYFETGALAA